MEALEMGGNTREIIKDKLRANFDGKIVRKDLTKKIKEGANVPVYVLEFLLGQYCSSDDEEVIEKGVQNVKRASEAYFGGQLCPAGRGAEDSLQIAQPWKPYRHRYDYRPAGYETGHLCCRVF